MKILITGAGGYIGSVATYLFLQKGYEVVAVDNISKGFRQPLEELQKQFGPEKLRFYEERVANISSVFEKEKNIETVVHYAAFCSVDESMKHPHQYFSNNTCSTEQLLDEMVKHSVLNLVFSSTCALYGDAQSALDENHPTDPKNPYGESKLMSETMIQWYAQLKGLRYMILRYFNVCGASDDGLIGDSKKPSVHLMQNAVRGALGIEPFYLTAPEVNTPDKTPIRDYVNVVDLNNAHIQALEYMQSGKSNEIINLGTGTGNSVLEIVNKVQEITGVTFDMQKTTPRQGEPPLLVASNEKAKRLLGWEPRHSLEDSVQSLLIWYRNHPHGWEQ